MAEAKSDRNNDTPPWEGKRNGNARGLVRKFFTWGIVLAVIAVIGYSLRPRPTEVEVGLVQRGPLTVHVVEEGKTRIRNRYIVSAPLAGQMRRVTLKAGDEVKAGETVVTSVEPTLAPFLDPRAKAQAEAKVQGATAALEQAGQALEMAKTAAQFAKSNWDRTQRVQDRASVSINDRENAERDSLMKQREVHASEFALKVAQFELEQAKATLTQLQSPAAAGTALDLRAPVSGRVLRVMQESAMVVAPGTAILEIGDPADIEIEAEILSRDAVGIKAGAEVTIEQWGGEQPLKGRVRRVEPAAFTKVSALGVEEQRVIVLCDLENPPTDAKTLGDRFRVEVRVAVWQGKDVLLVPGGALFREGSEWKTFVFDNGRAKKVTFEAGHSDGRMSEVIKGLEAGAKVLLHPPDTVKDGTAVKIRAEE